MPPIPLQSRLPKTYRIAQVKRETENVQTFTFDISFGALPGQFVMVWLPGVDEIPMSVAMDDGAHLKVTFFAVGDMTKKLAEKKVGDLIGIRGPFGTHYEWKPKQRLALLAGGYGAAPMSFVARRAAKDECPIDVFVGARSREHLLYIEELRSLPHTTVYVSTDDGSVGFQGYNIAHFSGLLERGEISVPDCVFGCGPERMLKALSDLCAEKKLSCQLSLERYMKCGFGLCGNCVVDPSGIRLCVDGPVVDNCACRNITEFGSYHRDDLGKKKPA